MSNSCINTALRDNRFRSFYSLNLYLNFFENNIPDGRFIVPLAREKARTI